MKRATLTLLCITLAASVAGTPREHVTQKGGGYHGAELHGESNTLPAVPSGASHRPMTLVCAVPSVCQSNRQGNGVGVRSSGLASMPALSGEASSFIVTASALRHGTWAYANSSYGSRYLAIPEGPGWNVTVCGPLGCLDRVSTDAGPELWLQRAGRIGDLAAIMFEEICGPLSPGLCSGSYTITGRADQHPEDPPEHPDDARMRLEDQPLPATSTEDVP